MHSQNHSFETTTPPPSSPPQPEEQKAKDLQNLNEDQEPKNYTDFDQSSDSSSREKDKFITAELLEEIRNALHCPICLGIIRKTRTVMECLHRFCRECIDKSMRLGNNECPTCRTHCASRRSLRDDPSYDIMIATIYGDIDKYEEEEFAFHGEEIARNKQSQASIAQTYHRQEEALRKKRTSSRTTAATYNRKQGNYRNLRGRKRHLEQDSDEDEGVNELNCSKDSSSADDHSVEFKSKRYKRRGTRTLQLSSGANTDGNCEDNDSLVNQELLAWGRRGMRSKNQRGGLSWAHGKISRYIRFTNLMDHLQCSSENNELMKVGLTLVSLHKEKILNLKRPYLSCSPTTYVGHLCQYVAMQRSMEASEIEILLINKYHPAKYSPDALNPSQNELQLLNENLTLGEIRASFTQENLILAFRQKEQGALSLSNSPNI